MEKVVVFKYSDVLCVGGPSRHNLKFTTGTMVKEDIDIIQNDGSLEHGFRIEGIESISVELCRISNIDTVIKNLEAVLSGLKEIKEE